MPLTPWTRTSIESHYLIECKHVSLPMGLMHATLLIPHQSRYAWDGEGEEGVGRLSPTSASHSGRLSLLSPSTADPSIPSIAEPIEFDVALVPPWLTALLFRLAARNNTRSAFFFAAGMLGEPTGSDSIMVVSATFVLLHLLSFRC